MTSTPVLANTPDIEEVALPSALPLKSPARQRLEQLQLTARCLLTRTEYRLYRFGEIDKDYRYMMNFMPGDLFANEFRNAVNDANWKHVLDNKWLFYIHYDRFGIPIPEVHGVYEPGIGFTNRGAPLASADDLRAYLMEARPSTLVIKPLGGIMGYKIYIFQEITYEGDTIHFVTNTGERLTFDDLADRLNKPYRVRYYQSGGYELNHSGFLVQSKVEQHEFLNAIAPYTTNTFRIVTFLNHAGEVNIHFTLLRLGRKGNVADNWDKGGVGVGVDPSTGVLGNGVVKPKYGLQWMQHHPDSGVRFTGLRVPYWDEILSVCTRAAKVTPKVRSVGWDVALTPDGPVIIEGNPDWDLAMVQVHTQGFLQPEVRAELAHFGLTFPENTLPTVSAHKWRRYLSERRRVRQFYKRTNLERR